MTYLLFREAFREEAACRTQARSELTCRGGPAQPQHLRLRVRKQGARKSRVAGRGGKETFLLAGSGSFVCVMERSEQYGSAGFSST